MGSGRLAAFAPRRTAAASVGRALALAGCLWGLGAACVQPQEEAGPCGAEGTSCDRNTLLSCGPDGGVVETPCGADRCASDAPVPQCVPALALPCVEGEVEPSCENGLLLACRPEAGYVLPTDCGPGALCAPRLHPPACAPVETQSCTVRGFQPLCVAGRRIECDGDRGRLVEAGDCAGR